MKRNGKGTLIVIGGHEDKKGDMVILKEVAEHAKRGNGCLVIVTVASQLPEEMAEEYFSIFKKLGVKEVESLDVRAREEAFEKTAGVLDHASAIFFTGGDQLRITSQIGDSIVYRKMHALYEKGVTIIGTSAGAAAMPETMLIAGPGDESNEISSIGMAPGLALIKDVVIDSHFAQRGRISRLLGAVAQNPRNLGLGIDENTAIIMEHDDTMRVLGSGGVYVIDGTGITYSGLSDKRPEGVLSIYGLKLHVLASGDRLDMADRRPLRTEKAAA